MNSDGETRAKPELEPLEFDTPRACAMLAVERKLQSGKSSPSAEEIIRALIAHSSEPIPPTVLSHIRARLGKTHRDQSGRPSDAEKNPLKVEIIYQSFMRYKDWLQSRQKTQGLIGWPQIRDADWWKGPPAERAARMVLRRWEFNMEWQSVQKRAYKTDKLRRRA